MKKSTMHETHPLNQAGLNQEAYCAFFMHRTVINTIEVKIMRSIAVIFLVVLLFIYVQVEISSLNPCSGFSPHPSLCNSDSL